MPTSLQIEIIAFGFIIILLTLYILKKGRIPVKYSLVWLFAGTIILIFGIIPNFFDIVSKFLGFELPSNLAFSLMIAILIFINLSLTIIVSGQKEKTRLLIQEISILKKELDDKK